MLIAALFTVTGQILWKVAMMQGELVDLVKFGENFWDVFLPLFLGFVSYGIGAALMIFAYRYGQVSLLHPFLGAAYILSLFAGAILFSEVINALKIAGVIIIIAGLVFLAWSAFAAEGKKQ